MTRHRGRPVVRRRCVLIESLEERRLFSVVNGLTGTYYDNADLTGASLTRIDSNVNFDWGTGTPTPVVGTDIFSVRWTGSVQAKVTGTHTFYTLSDDGARLWVNGQLLVDKWKNQSASTYYGTINLVAGQKYDVKLEYFDSGGKAVAKLLWFATGFAREVIPTANLFTNDTTTPTVPATPTGLTATATSTTAVSLKWNDVATESGYKIERRLNVTGAAWAQIGTTNANVVTFNNTGLTAGTAYQYRVRANNAVGDSQYSNVANVTTLVAPTVPPTPSGLTGTPTSPTTATLNWADVATETGYKIERRLNVTGAAWAQVGTTGANVVTFGDTNLIANTAYQYRVRANNAIGDSQYSNIVDVTTPATPTVPATPSGLVATATSSTAVTLAWSDVATETGYKIERRLNVTGAAWAQIGTTGANVVTFNNNTGLTAATAYQYRVRANNAVGDSQYSNIVDVTTLAATYKPAFSTFLGGSGFEQARDIAVDAQGNIYVTGGGDSTNFPTTAGAFDPTPNGSVDVFVTKYSSTGQVLWSTVLGGSQYDRAYGIEVDAQGYVYIAGRAGPGFPTTAGAFQPTYNGYYSGTLYGNENAFIAKIKPDGSGVVWATYFGSYELIRDLAIDSSGNVYVAGSQRDTETGTPAPAAWFANAYQKTPKGGNDLVVAKVKADGTAVLWATYYGGTGNDGGAPSIRVDSQNRPVVYGITFSSDLPVSANAFQKTYGGASDMFAAKFSADGSQLLFGSYLGGSGNESTETHNLVLDSADNLYVSASTASTNFPVTAGAFQTTFGGGTTDAFLTKISADGSSILYSTFFGGNGNDAAEGLSIDSLGNVYMTGPTRSTNLKTAGSPLRTTNAGGADMYVAKFSPDLGKLLYGTYIGGAGDDSARTNTVDANGNLYIAGQVGTGFYSLNAVQPIYGGGTSDAAVVKLILA